MVFDLGLLTAGAVRRSGWRRAVGRHVAAAVATVLVVSGLSAQGIPQSSATTPGDPGNPQPGTLVFQEDFQNTTGTVGVPITGFKALTGYAGSSDYGSMAYSAGSAWLPSWGGCNGWVTGRGVTISLPPNDDTGCARSTSPWPNGWAYSQGLAYAIGVAQGMSNADANQALTAFTNGAAPAQGGPGQQVGIMLETTSPIAAPGSRFYAVTAYFAAINCSDTVAPSLYNNGPLVNLYLLVGGVQRPLDTANQNLNPCTMKVGDPGFTLVEDVQIVGGSGAGLNPKVKVNVARFYSTAYLMGTAAAYDLGLRLYNANPNYSGNDAAFDMVRIIDVTPQLDVEFSPSAIQVGETSRLTFTITNTDDLQAKPGWFFASALPTGVKLSATPNMTTDCGPGVVVTAPAGATSIGVDNGALAQNTASCTVSVDVTARAGQYTIGPSDITAYDGVNLPATADLTVVLPPPVITGPTDGDVLDNGSPDITGTGSEPGNTITVKEGGAVICEATVQDDLTWLCTPTSPLAGGDHTVTAIETDPAGTSSEPSDPVTFTVKKNVIALTGGSLGGGAPGAIGGLVALAGLLLLMSWSLRRRACQAMPEPRSGAWGEFKAVAGKL